LTESVNILTARVAELEAELEQAQSNAVEISNRFFEYHLAFRDDNGTHIIFDTSPNNNEFIFTSAEIKALSNKSTLVDFSLYDNFDLNVPNLDINTHVVQYYHAVTDLYHVNGHTSLVFNSDNHMGFNFDSVDALSKTTYRVTVNDISYTKYTNEELLEIYGEDFSIAPEVFYVKNITVNLTIAVEDYSDEFFLQPQLGVYMTEDGSRGYRFYKDVDFIMYESYSNEHWRPGSYVYNFHVDNGNIMSFGSRYDYKWLTSDSFILLENGEEVDGVVFTKRPAIDLLKDALANGGTVRLTEDITLDNETLEVTAENVTIHLGGHTITGANVDGAVIKVNAGSELALIGTGTIRGGSGADCRCVEVQGRLFIQDVTMSVGPDANGKGNSCIFVNADGAYVGIVSGTFETDVDWDGFYYVVNVKNNVQNADIAIWGGTFKNYNPSTGDDVLGGNYVLDGYYVVTETDGTDTYYSVVHKELETVFFSENNKIKVYNNNDFEFVQLGNEYDILAHGTMSIDETTGVVTLTFADGSTQEIQLNEELTSFELDGETFVMFNPEIHYEFYGHYWDVNGYTEDTFEMRFDYTFKLIKHSSNYNEELDVYEPIVIERTGTFETSFDDMTGQGTITLHFENGETIVGHWHTDGSFDVELNGDELFFVKQ